MLISGDLDAAFIVAGKLSIAPKKALESGNCSLLDLRDVITQIITKITDLIEVEIPANFYVNQTQTIQTVGAEALLLCRKDLDKELVFLVVNTLFDNIGNLLLAHARAEDIRLETAFNDLPTTVLLHPGSREFQEREQKELLIATGSMGGRYYDLGNRIRLLIEEYGIPARVIQTEGSLENAALLLARPTLAIMQYDFALASCWGAPEHVYKLSEFPSDIKIPQVKNLRRIATLHNETVHIMIRRDLLSQVENEQPSIHALLNTRICLGPLNSGTHVLSRIILNHHGIYPSQATALSVSGMVDRIHGGDIDAGFFISRVPSMAVRSLLDHDQIRLLPVEPAKMTKLVGPTLSASRIPPGTYACQLEGEPGIESIETKALLVTTANLPFDVYKITEAIFEGAAFLDMDDKSMAAVRPSIPLHPDTEDYFRKAGYLPKPPHVEVLRQFWYLLAILAIILTGYQGLLIRGRNKTARQHRIDIYSVPIDADNPNAVSLLFEIREELIGKIRLKELPFWRLDESRRQELKAIIAERISVARENQTRMLFRKIIDSYKEKSKELVSTELALALEEEIRTRFEKGDLDEAQHRFLMDTLRDQQRKYST
jgi:TRAP transporter TAXI family solute receptor